MDVILVSPSCCQQLGDAVPRGLGTCLEAPGFPQSIGSFEPMNADSVHAISSFVPQGHYEGLWEKLDLLLEIPFATGNFDRNGDRTC